MATIKRLYQNFGSSLKMKLIAGERGLLRKVKVPELQRPGLSLSGYLNAKPVRRVLIFGRAEVSYVKNLEPEERFDRLKIVIHAKIPAVIVARGNRPCKEILALCREYNVPLFVSAMPTMTLFNKLAVILSEEFSKKISVHGTLVEAFGVGVLIQGDSSVGKSEAALGLIERGHRLISDDVVKIKRREGGYLEGAGPELTRHLLEIRGIGIINVAHLYGAVCISESRRIDMIIKLEVWDDSHFYDRVGLEERYDDILGIKVPSYLLPVKPGRDVVLLIETTVLNHRLKKMGYHSAKEFNMKLLQEIAKRTKRKSPL